MKLVYKVDENMYAEAVEYQMNIRYRQPSQVLVYLATSIGFTVLALYFAVTRGEYSWWIRLAPVAMALIVFGLQTYRRTNLPARAKSSTKRMLRQKMLSSGYFGEHTLIVENGQIRCKADGKWTEVQTAAFGALLKQKTVTLLIANGVIFEIIPNAVLEQDNVLHELQVLLSPEQASRFEEAESAVPDALMEVSWEVDQNLYVQGMVTGHRKYYSTLGAWRGSPLIRLIILGYGFVVLALRLNIYIGLAFILIGLLLNRQLLVTFSPLSYAVVSRQVEQAKGNRTSMGTETFYITKTMLHVHCMGQLQKTKLAEICAHRQNNAFDFFYTKDGQMVVLPAAVFGSAEERDTFVRKILREKSI